MESRFMQWMRRKQPRREIFENNDGELIPKTLTIHLMERRTFIRSRADCEYDGSPGANSQQRQRRRDYPD